MVGKVYVSMHMRMGRSSCAVCEPLGGGIATFKKHLAATSKHGSWHTGMKAANATYDDNIRQNVKFAAIELDYFCTRGIPPSSVDTHSLRSGGVIV